MRPARTWLAVLLVALAVVCFLVLRLVLITGNSARDHARSPAAQCSKPHTASQAEQPPERDAASKAPNAGDAAAVSPEQADEERVIHVLVLSPEGKPVQGAQVSVLGQMAPFTRTKSDGRFTLRIDAERGGSMPSPGSGGSMRPPSSSGYPSRDSAGSDTSAPDEFLISVWHRDYACTQSGPYSRSHPPDEVTITMLRGGRIAGRVVDEQGHPIGGIHVIVSVDAEHAGESLDLLEWQTPRLLRAEADGSLVTCPLRPATYLVAADTTYDRYGSGRGEQIPELAPCEPVKVRVEADETTQNVELVVTGGYTVSGYVLDLDENPIQGARVSCRGIERTASAAADGSFALRALPSGELRGLAWADGCLRRDLRYEPPQADLVIHLLPAPRIVGRVVDKATGLPIEHFYVALQSTSSTDRYDERDVYGVLMEQFDSPDGRFELCLDGLVGRTIYVSAPGHATYCAEAVQPRDTLEPDELLVKLVPGAAVTVSVNSAVDGSPIAGASISHPAFDVTTVDEHVDLVRQCPETDEDGRCILERVPPGRCRLTAYHSDYETRSQEVEVPEGAIEVAVQFTLGDTFTLRGRVVTARGAEPVPGARVRAYADTAGLGWEEPAVQAVTDERGCFEISGLSQQTCELQADCDDYDAATVSVELPRPPGEEAVIEIVPLGRVIGSVKTSDGRPVKDASVTYWRRGQPAQSDWVNSDGEYSFDRVPAGACLVTVQLPEPNATMARWVVAPQRAETRADFTVEGVSVLGGVSRGEELARFGNVVATRKTGFSLDGSGRASADIDWTGHYRLERLVPGTYLLEVTASFRSDHWSDTHTTRELTVGDADVQLDIRFGGIGRIAGTVRLSNGWPASEARVHLAPRIPDGERSACLERAYAGDSAETKTDEDGLFTFPDVAPGQYTLTVTRPGYAVATAPIEKADERDLASLQIVLQPEATVLARLDVADGKLPRRVGVSVCDPSGRLLASHDDLLVRSDGTFEVLNVPPGSYLLDITADGYAPCRKAVTAPTGDRIHVTLDRGHSASVAVRDASGNALPFASVILDVGGDPHRAAELIRSRGLAQTDEIGRAQITYLADGAYTLRVCCDGYEDASVPVTIGGRDAEVRVTLKRRTE